jgi:hypothetical protein
MKRFTVVVPVLVTVKDNACVVFGFTVTAVVTAVTVYVGGRRTGFLT